MAYEVGLRPRGLCTVLDGRWRVDIGALWRQQIHFFEVKGTRADYAREILDAGKWVHPWPALWPWLVVDVRVDARQPPAGWGLMTVDGDRLKVVNEPLAAAETMSPTDVEALGTVLCLQSLPKMMGLTQSQRVIALAGFERPWRLWR